MYGYNINTLPNTKLGLMAKNGTITILDRRHPVKIVTAGGFRVGIEGQEYYEHIDEGNPNDYQSLLPKGDVDFSVLVAHGMLLDHDFFNGVKYTNLYDISTDADVVFAGHYHPGLPAIVTDGTAYCNPGSLLRIENTKENRISLPKVAILDIDESTGKFNITYHVLSCSKIGDLVFTDKEDIKSYDEVLTEFHTKIKNSNFKGVDIVKMVDDYIIDNGEDLVLGQMVKDKIIAFSIQNSVDAGFIPSNNSVYINRVEIKNFQAHKHIVIDFVNGMNVIKGESNAGKSAILRAIYWVLYDKPNGSDFITTGAKSCSVRLHLSNGFIIERKRTKSSSGSYLLTKPGDTIAQEFKGFSNSIPVDITNAHQMPELRINGTSYRINIASQLDTPFLIGNNSADRISLIGSLVDANRADEAKKDFLSDKRRKTIEKKQFETILLSKQNELKKYDYLTKLGKHIKVLEVAIKKLEDDEKELDDLNQVYNDYAIAVNDLSEISGKLDSIDIPDKDLLYDYKKYIDELEELETMYTEYNSCNNQLDSIDNKLNSIPDEKSFNKLIKDYKKIIKELSELETISSEYNNLSEMTFEFDYDLDELNDIIKQYQDLVNDIEELDKLELEYNSLESPSDIDNKINEIENKLLSIQEEKDKYLEALNKEEAICPYCNQKIDFNLALK